MAIYHMLFQDREMFMKALEKEGKDNKAKPKKERTNFTRDFIMTAFSEFFIYTAECGNSEWIKVVETKIKWTEFRENTLKSADYMRKCARFADAPRVRNWRKLNLYLTLISSPGKRVSPCDQRVAAHQGHADPHCLPLSKEELHSDNFGRIQCCSGHLGNNQEDRA